VWGLSPDAATPLDEQLRGLARAQRILAANGHAHLSLGHMSLRDPAGRGFWLKRRGLGLEEAEGAGDFLLLDLDGQAAGLEHRHAEWPIHAGIYRARPDVHAVAHSHPTHAAAFSATEAEIQAATAEGNFLAGRVAYYRRMPGLIATPELGRELAGCLGACWVVLMKNHGLTSCGPTVAAAALASLFAESACRVQLLLGASGLAWSAPDARELAPGGASRLELSPRLVGEFWAYLGRDLDRREGAPSAGRPGPAC